MISLAAKIFSEIIFVKFVFKCNMIIPNESLSQFINIL
jgi:hypothetical protein